MMLKRWRTILALGLGISGLPETSVAAGAATWRDFQAGSFTSKGNLQMVYRLFVPKNYDAKKAYPLMLSLHGAGDWGNNDTLQLETTFSTMWADSANQAKYPAFVLAPQCPANCTDNSPWGWVNTDWTKGTYPYVTTPITLNLQAVVELLDSVSRQYHVDTLREYISGMSMGGYATWYLVMRFPQRFAAAVPVCGAADTSLATSIRKVPLWAFHAADDNVVPVAGSRQMITSLRAAGAAPKYTEYAANLGVGHLSWVPASQDTGLVPWVFAQFRSIPVPIFGIYPKPAHSGFFLSPTPAIDALGQRNKQFPILKN